MTAETTEPISFIVAADTGTREVDVVRTLVSIGSSGEPHVVVACPEGFNLSPELETEVPAHTQWVTFDPLSESPSVAVNRAFGQVEGSKIALLTAGMLITTQSLEPLQSALANATDAFITRQTQQIRAIVELGLDDLRSLTRSGLGQRADVSMLGRQASQGFVAFTRSVFSTIRGLDHSILELDAAITDFIERARRFGLRQDWADASVTVFRISARMNARETAPALVHQPERETTTKAPIFRNLTSWDYSSAADAPLVSIVISTYNRSDYLADCINSILAQSFRDFELVLVDDGSTDATASVVASFDDPRIRYFQRENSGISAARNFGTRQARGAFIAVHDDDDLMLPWRLERQLASLGPGDHGCFGVSVHFDNETGEMSRLVHRKFNVQTAMRYGHNPTHPTWLIRRNVFERFNYDETLKSGVDNNVALRMVKSGVKFRHTGESLILRRMHGRQITRTAGEIQSASAKMSQRMLRFGNGLAEDPTTTPGGEEWLPSIGDKPFEAEVRMFLPDHLVRRTVLLRSTNGDADLGDVIRSIGRLDYRLRAESADGAFEDVAEVHNVTLAGLVQLRQAGISYEVKVAEHDAGTSEGEHGTSMVRSWIDSNFIQNQSQGGFRVLLLKFDDVGPSVRQLADGVEGHTCRAESPSSVVQAFVSSALTPRDASIAYKRVAAQSPACAVSILSVGPKVFPAVLVDSLEAKGNQS
ncbi:MAG: glycosyl transferase family 2 [Micrococcaceae bacterium]|nr:glycosyl transferase family 2 [Micrococcaceae bacterium]